MRPKTLSRVAEIALRLDTREAIAKSLTKAQRRALNIAKKKGSLEAYMQNRRMCEQLARDGMLSKTGLCYYALTEMGAAVLAVKV